MFNKLRRKLGYVKLDEIKIYKEFKQHPPRWDKLMEKNIYFGTHGKFEQPIVLNQFNYLKDGYTSYLIAEDMGWKWVKVKRVYDVY